MRILVVCPHPFYLDGEGVWALIRKLHGVDNEIRVILPGDKGIREGELRPIVQRIGVRIGKEEISANIKGTIREGILIYVVEGEEGLCEKGVDEKLILFSRVVLRLLKIVDWRPDAIHCNGWQTGLLPIYLNTQYRDDPFYEGCATIFTIHDLKDQALFSRDRFQLTGLEGEESLQRLLIGEEYSLLKGGVLFSDLVNTVSKGYAKEIQGMGPFGLRGESIRWVLHGIDYDVWDPAKDSSIHKRYDSTHLGGKRTNKKRLLREQGIRGDPPLVGMLLSGGEMDLLLKAMDELMEYGLGMVVCGEGEDRSWHSLHELEGRYRGRLRVNLKYDEGLAHRIYAGADILVLPSAHEPYGHKGMIALRYGTPPVVMSTGGLKDVVREFNPTTFQGNGFVFHEYTKEAFLDAIGRALFFYKDRVLWKRLILNGMQTRFSLDDTSTGYLNLYREAIKRHLERWPPY
jgi:starch synthase